ncbi:MAG: Efflux transport system, outer membrane factor (OMF) lipoprotein [uncultured Sphingomonas sp.]|uniref:Efflux transport system, outer membrane factor (OMF) lipoprotein n=1 Tax=uncultured Sphingomonas sp. TaxID=158754 RepID=A0A6J4SL70_9SPHN|nr:MAG: Efflux transport system, outer membrane factor (OMF) lipoprotein [uncultured Sphingomonas sp.]
MKPAPLLALLALAACTTAQPRSPAVQSVPPAYAAARTAGLPPADWWRNRLGDPALARLVAAALANSPDLAAAAARIQQARAGLGVSQAERMPILNGNGSVTFNRSSPNEGGIGSIDIPGAPEIDHEKVFYRAGIEGSWDSDLFGRLRADARAASARLDAAGFDAAAVRLALVTDVARNLVAARSALAREDVAQATTRSARESLEVSARKVRAGLVPGIDLTRAETLVAETASAVPKFEAEQSARVAALAALTGLAPVEIRSLVESELDIPHFEAPAAGVPSDLLLRRPDIVAALTRVAAADQDTASAIAERYPRLSITATLGLVATALGDLFSADALTGSVGPGLAGPLLDFRRNRARVEQARGRASEAVASYRQTVLRAFSEVETQLASVDARRRQIIALERQLAAAEETTRIARVQYRSGLTDYLGVLDAERTANRARDQLAVARGDLSDAQLALYRAIGGDFGSKEVSQ